jgi:hypothetical protein
LSDLSLDDFKAADAGLDQSVYQVLGAEHATGEFASYGSTGPAQVAEQLFLWKQKLSHNPVS